MRLEEYRKRRALSCEQAGRQIGVDESTFNRWERGETVPGGEHLVRLVQWAGGALTIDDIMAPSRERKARAQEGGAA